MKKRLLLYKTREKILIVDSPYGRTALNIFYVKQASILPGHEPMRLYAEL